MTDAELRKSVAENAADSIVLRYSHLPQGKRVKLWAESYDAIMAGLLAYEHMASVQRTRARAKVSEN